MYIVEMYMYAYTVMNIISYTQAKLILYNKKIHMATNLLKVSFNKVYSPFEI